MMEGIDRAEDAGQVKNMVKQEKTGKVREKAKKQRKKAVKDYLMIFF
jgi:hypothetical protein